MIDLAERQRQRAVADRKTYLVNQLYKLGIYQTRNGMEIEEVQLAELEQVYINEQCRSAIAYGEHV